MRNWRGFVCLIFRHRYVLAQELTNHSRRVCCSRCRKSFAMNDECRSLVDWDADFHRMYEQHGITIEYKPWEFNPRCPIGEQEGWMA